ncbi:hypothetical protein IE077_001586 [Cardiosporidium cionae]|uniref:RWD domain-containing protein n=1 Tax=Cardiosporidium cionae TaxID=476202 RepID=A0ABQ7J558_9APIC|nr:hypothetical protein IE077_001586 [Cardiosporidium cionae]|eukprot:KAF8819139.1 hypothetical protein IE077_001586 [Cardiosporidium cionae]
MTASAEAIRDELLSITSFYDVSLEYVDSIFWEGERFHELEEEDSDAAHVVFHDDISEQRSSPIQGKSILRLYSMAKERVDVSSYCWIDLEITFFHGYPDVLPTFLVSNSHGISFSLQEKLQSTLHSFLLKRPIATLNVTAAVQFVQNCLQNLTKSQPFIKQHSSSVPKTEISPFIRQRRAISEFDLSSSYPKKKNFDETNDGHYSSQERMDLSTRKGKRRRNIHTLQERRKSGEIAQAELSTLSFTKSSRFLREYEELQLVGSGGFG